MHTMNRTLFLVVTAMIVAPAAALAQSPAGAEGKGADRRHEMRERLKAAHEACKDASDRRACLHEKMCETSADPAKCRAETAERHKRLIARMEERQAMHEACSGKRGEELMKCLAEQRRSHHGEHRK
jgi:hypothetical protein